MPMTPLAITIMLECCVSDDPGANIRAGIWYSEAAAEARARLVKLGLIDAGTWRATTLGEAYVGALMTTPVPAPEMAF